jgi:hypothetical protein
MKYDHLIKRPFEIVARRPYLWFLGFLAGTATAFNVPNGGTNYGRRGTSDAYEGPSWAALQNIWNQNGELIVGILAVFVVLCIVMFVLGCIATGGIIHAAVEHDDGHEYTLGKAWRAGYETGWRIAGLRLLAFLLTVLPGVLIGTLVVAAVAGAMDSAGARQWVSDSWRLQSCPSRSPSGSCSAWRSSSPKGSSFSKTAMWLRA